MGNVYPYEDVNHMDIGDIPLVFRGRFVGDIPLVFRGVSPYLIKCICLPDPRTAGKNQIFPHLAGMPHLPVEMSSLPHSFRKNLPFITAFVYF